VGWELRVGGGEVRREEEMMVESVRIILGRKRGERSIFLTPFTLLLFLPHHPHPL
jgi:hypothetical protein